MFGLLLRMAAEKKEIVLFETAILIADQMVVKKIGENVG